MSDHVERELKLVPADPSILEALARAERLGPFIALRRRLDVQRNSFFDSRSRALSAARVGFRRRTIEGQRLATWSIKGDTALLRGVATRAEIELQLEPDLAPALVIGTLRDAARTRGAGALAEAVADALGAGGLPLPTPVLELVTERTAIDLEATEQQWAIELALDRVSLVGHQYTELEIEAELKRGDEAALEAIRAAITEIGAAEEAHSSKLSRALAHLSACRC